MKWFCLITLFCVSCGSNPVSQPFVAQPLNKKKPELTKPAEKERATPKSEAKSEPKPAEPKRKVLTGQVTFENLSEEELAAFRVIPEEGKHLIIPKNKTYDQVEGFWWRKSKANEWFKIPDSSAAWIGNGEVPKKFDRVAHQNQLKVHYRSGVLLQFVGVLKNGVKEPGWFPNAGQTRSPVASPWRG